MKSSKDIEAKYPMLLMAYDSGEYYGVWLPPLEFVLLDKETLDVVKSLNLKEATEIIQNSKPLFEVDDEDKPSDEVKETI